LNLSSITGNWKLGMNVTFDPTSINSNKYWTNLNLRYLNQIFSILQSFYRFLSVHPLGHVVYSPAPLSVRPLMCRADAVASAFTLDRWRETWLKAVPGEYCCIVFVTRTWDRVPRWEVGSTRGGPNNFHILCNSGSNVLTDHSSLWPANTPFGHIFETLPVGGRVKETDSSFMRSLPHHTPLPYTCIYGSYTLQILIS